MLFDGRILHIVEFRPYFENRKVGYSYKKIQKREETNESKNTHHHFPEESLLENDI